MAIPSLFKKLLFSKQFKYEKGRFYLMTEVPGVILPLDVWVKLQKSLMDVDKDEAIKIISKIAFEQGENAGKRYKMRVTSSFKGLLKFSKELSEVLGMGVITYLKGGGSEVIFNISPSPFAERFVELYGRTKEPVCYYLSNIAAGAFSGFTGKRWVAEEVKCVAKGDLYCQVMLRVKR